VARIKQTHLAGSWYAGDERSLREQVDTLLDAAPPPGPPTGALAGLIVPHAGYAYSGRAAAVGYVTLRSAPYERAVILAPSHFSAFRGLAVLDVDSFETPLGAVAVDRGGVATLLDRPLVCADPEPYREEHSLEIQLPFLQRVLPDARVVPALVGECTADDYDELAATLHELADPRTIFIISSDFVHYGWRFGYMPFPASGPDAVRAGLRQLDTGAFELICGGDAAAFRRYVDATGATICGRNPISLFLALHVQRARGRLLTYYTSLDVTGDYEHCVSYASIAFPRNEGVPDQS